MKLDPFYPVVDSSEWIERLVPLGVKLVQLRMKDVGSDEVRRQIRAAKSVCENHDCVLVINDYWQLAIEEGCEWLHLGQEDLVTADIAAIRAAGVKLGLSSHDHRELETALANNPDYLALGPIYATISKQMHWKPQGLDRLREWKARIAPLPLVAIGGIGIDRLSGVLEAGADSAAVLTDITLNADPEARTREWIEKTAAWRS